MNVVINQTPEAIIEAQKFLISHGCTWAGCDTEPFNFLYPLRRYSPDRFVRINVYLKLDNLMVYNTNIDSPFYGVRGEEISIHFNEENKYKISAYIKHNTLMPTYNPRKIEK